MSFKPRARFFGKRNQFKKAATKKPLATKSYVKSMISREIETKYADTIGFGTVVSSAGTLSSNLISTTQGVADFGQRVGDRLKLKGSIEFRAISAKGDTDQIMRMVVFQWKPNDALIAPSISSILRNGPTGVPDWASLYVYDYSSQYTILYDKTFLWGADILYHHHDYRIPIKLHQVQYTAASTACSNGIYIIFLSDSAAIVHPTISYSARVRYDDA